MRNQFRFVDRWHIDAPLADVYEFVGNTLGYPAWWGRVFLSVTGDPGPPRPGRRAQIESRGFLPYLLRWEGVVTETDEPHSFEFAMTGDFVGNGRWTFEAASEGTVAVFEFAPRVEKPVVKYLSPVLKPVFRWNHRWAMKRGQVGVTAHFSGQPAR